MKAGDLIEWKGANRNYSGRVTEGENGTLLVIVDNAHTFALNDLLSSKGLKLKCQSTSA